MTQYVYCDESMSEAFVNQRDGRAFLCIGSVWIDSERVADYRAAIEELRRKFRIFGELKWRKVTPASVNFYLSLVELFFSAGLDMRFRSIVVSTEKFDLRWHKNDPELGFYKFYYQMLAHRLAPQENYRIFCDLRSTADRGRLSDLQRCLQSKASHLEVQGLPSSEVVIIQLCDVLLGAVSACYNQSRIESPAKAQVVARIEQRIGRSIGPTFLSEQKFNVFEIEPGRAR